MWKSVLSYTLSSSNYGIANMHNVYNFIVSVMDILNDEQNQQLVDSLILHMGRTFYKDFRNYLINKLPNSRHTALVNRIV